MYIINSNSVIYYESNEKYFKINLFWYVSLILISVFSVMSFYEVFRDSGIIYFGKYFFLLLFIIMITQIIDKNNINLYQLIIFSCFSLFYYLLSFISIGDSLTGYYTEALTNLSMYFLVGILSLFVFPQISFKKFKTIIVFFLIITFLFVTLPSLLNIGNTEYYSDINYRERYLGIFNNPNALSRFSLLGVILSVRLWTIFEGKKYKFIFLFMIISNSYLIFLSDSRASIISLFVLFSIILFITLFNNIPKTFNYFLLSLLGVLLTVVVGWVFNANFFIDYLDINNLTSGRISIWSEILTFNMVEFFLGSGPMQELDSHNGYLEIFKYFGIIGLILWSGIFIYLISKKAKATVENKKLTDSVGFAIVIMFLVYHLVEGSMVSLANLTSIYFWLELSQRNSN